MSADPARQRALRRQLVLLLLLSPSLCGLPLLALIAPAGTIRWLILGVSSVIGAMLIGLAWRTLRALQTLQREDSDG